MIVVIVLNSQFSEPGSCQREVNFFRCVARPVSGKKLGNYLLGGGELNLEGGEQHKCKNTVSCKIRKSNAKFSSVGGYRTKGKSSSGGLPVAQIA